jgi:signal transduction histidine kinase
VSRHTLLVVSRAAAAVTAALLLVDIGLTVADTTIDVGDVQFVVTFAVGIIAMGVIGAVLSSRAPSNPIGWLFQGTAFCVALAVSTSQYAIRSVTDLTGLPAGPALAMVSQVVVPAIGASVLAIFLLFPDGRVLTPRWRPALWLLITGAGLGAVVSVLGQPRTQLKSRYYVENPFAILPRPVWAVAATIVGLMIALGGVPALVSMIVRFRRSRGEERQQMRWLAAAAALLLLSIVALVVTGIFAGPDGTSPANDAAAVAMILVAAVGLPLAGAIAILRYRLYDLDLVIQKAAVYTIVAIVLTVVYAAALAIAALSFLGSVAAVVLFVLTFNPVRRRAQRVAERIVYGTRATPFEVLSEFSERVGETYSIDEVLPRMAQLLAASIGATEVRVWLRREGTLAPVSAWPEGLEDVGPVGITGDELPPAAGASSFPVTHQGELLGAITLRVPANDPMNATKERLVTGLASQAGLALRNVRLVEDLRASRRRIVSAQDERAKRLERDIHDGAQQQLVALAVKLRLADTMVDRDAGAAHELLGQLQAEAGDALENLRDLARGIYPPLLADKGLPAALDGQVRKSPVPVTLDADGVGRYAPEVEAAVYFCSLEALNNIAKYASASRVEVRLAQSNGNLMFEIRDDGAGFEAATAAHGTGLQGMADRLEAIGGSLTVTSAPGAGTTVSGQVPVSPA